MKELQKKLDLTLSKAGQYNRYQIIIVILFSLQFMCSQFFHNNFSYLITRPFIIYKNNTKIRIDPKICNEFLNNITDSNVLRENQVPKTSIILDYKLYCDNFKTYLISIFYYFGIIIGSAISYHFYDKVGAKLTLGIFILLQIICLLLFQILFFDIFKNNLFILYPNLFVLGMSEYIIINILFLYICDIIHLSKIPMFITIIISGRPISCLLGIYFLTFLNLNWKTDLSFIAGVDIIIYIFILIYMVSSPKVALRNNNYINFIKNLLKISKINKKILLKKDFDFLLSFMNEKEKEEYESIFLSNENAPKKDDKGDITHKRKKNNKSDLLLNEALLINNEFGEEDKLHSNLKEEYLLSEDNNKIGSIKTLINKTKMADYSPLDLFRFKSQLINFSILSFIWAVYNFIKYGLNFTAKEIPEYNNNPIWVIAKHVIGLLMLYLIMLMYISHPRAFYKLLLSIQIISFLSLLLALHLDNVSISKSTYIFSILIVQICWNSLYLLLILISLLIYPIMLRSKGLGFNIAFGTIGKLVIMFLVDLKNEHEYILYFLIFDFLLLIFSNGLPKRIGSFVLDLPKSEENKVNIIERIESIDANSQDEYSGLVFNESKSNN